MVMWYGIANELQPNRVNPGICTHAEVHNVMDHEAGETCFLFSQCYGILHAEITICGKIYIGINLWITCG